MLFFQTWQQAIAYLVANSGHGLAKLETDRAKQNHMQAVWMFFMVVLFLFTIFTGVLCGYHIYLIMSGQTTWEHSGRMNITYLKAYKHGQMPFYRGIFGNIKQVFCHGGKC
jgi:hypothetical protein